MSEPFVKVLPEIRDVLVIMREASDNLYALSHNRPSDQDRLGWKMCTTMEIEQAIETVDSLQDLIGYAQPTHRVPRGTSAHQCMHDARYFWWFTFELVSECRADDKYLHPTEQAMRLCMDTVRMMMANTRLCLEYCKEVIEDGQIVD